MAKRNGIAAKKRGRYESTVRKNNQTETGGKKGSNGGWK